MNWVPKQLGAEPKKVAILGGLALVLVYLVWSILFSGGSSSQPVPTPQARSLTPYAGVAPEAPPPTVSAEPSSRRSATTRTARTTTLEDFKPSMKRARLAATDPAQVDPTLRVDLLARLQSVKFEGNTRSLFEFAPGPVKALPKILVAPSAPMPVEPLKPAALPPPPPFPLKFYGFVNPSRPDIKRAFFLDGDDIRVASEGETIHNRYRIVRISINSAVVEDVQSKNRQTLPLVGEEQG